MAYRRNTRPPAAEPSSIGFWLVVGVVILIAFMSMMAWASAHDAADWIRRGDYKNAVGELCCGERDCAEIDSADIKVTGSGYLIKSIGETVPFEEAAPSPNGRYWRCYWGGKRKCFFAPPGAV